MSRSVRSADPAVTKARFRFIEDMAVDARLSAFGFRVGWLLVSRYWNRASGRCDPGVDTLAGVLQVDEKTVRRGLRELIDLGYFIDRARGKGLTKQYWPRFDDRAKLSDQDRAKMSGHKGGKTGQICPDDRAELSAPRTGQKCPVPMNHEKPGNEPCRDGAPQAPLSLHQSLDSESEENEPHRRALEGSPRVSDSADRLEVGMDIRALHDETDEMVICRVTRIDPDGFYGKVALPDGTTLRVCLADDPPVLMLPDDGDTDTDTDTDDSWSSSGPFGGSDELPPSLDKPNAHTGTHDEG